MKRLVPRFNITGFIKKKEKTIPKNLASSSDEFISRIANESFTADEIRARINEIKELVIEDLAKQGITFNEDKWLPQVQLALLAVEASLNNRDIDLNLLSDRLFAGELRTGAGKTYVAVLTAHLVLSADKRAKKYVESGGTDTRAVHYVDQMKEETRLHS